MKRIALATPMVLIVLNFALAILAFALPVDPGICDFCGK